MSRFVQLHSVAAVVIGTGILLVGAALGLGVASWAGHPVIDGARVPVYITQVRGAESAVSANGMGFAPLFQAALPAVVSITSSRVVKVPQNPFFNDPFFQQFFGGQGQRAPQEQREKGLGSGVVVSADGYILTNNHVVDKGTEIRVMLPDRRQFSGKVIGTDPKTDVAVVKIEATGLPTIPLGDSSKIQVGDYAFAIGNPFGVGETATMGIVSATGRNGLSIEDYEDFIQTDAAINPGNSGGALINARAEVIGINTAILAGGSGGNQGIGFAIPINMAKYVMDEILKHGKVVRGYIGVTLQEISPELAKAFHVPPETGALVSGVDPDSPGAKAGLQRGDVITELNGAPISGPNDLRLKVGTMTPGTTVRLKVIRNGDARDVGMTLGEAPASKGGANAPGGGSAENSPMREVQVDELTGEIRQQLGQQPQRLPRVTQLVSREADGAAGLEREFVVAT